jgi:hypothetical protein
MGWLRPRIVTFFVTLGRGTGFAMPNMASAANLKFLSVSLQVRYGNFKFKAALQTYIF